MLIVCAAVFCFGMILLLRAAYFRSRAKHIRKHGRAYVGRVVLLDVVIVPEKTRGWNMDPSINYRERPMFMIEEIEIDGQPLYVESIEYLPCDAYKEGDEVEILFLPGYSTKAVVKEEFQKRAFGGERIGLLLAVFSVFLFLFSIKR